MFINKILLTFSAGSFFLIVSGCSLAPESEFTYEVVRGKKEALKDKKIVSDTGSSASVPKDAFDTDATISIGTASTEEIGKIQDLTKDKILDGVKISARNAKSVLLNNPKTDIKVCMPANGETDLSKIIAYESDTQNKQTSQVASNKITLEESQICIATKVTNGEIFLARAPSALPSSVNQNSLVRGFKFFEADATFDIEKTQFKARESVFIKIKALSETGEILENIEGLLSLSFKGPSNIEPQNLTFTKEEKGQKSLEVVFEEPGNHEVVFDFYGVKSNLTLTVTGTPSLDVPADIDITTNNLYPIPPDPKDLTVTLRSTNRIVLSWLSSEGSTTSFKVSYQIGETAPASCLVGIPTSVSALSLSLSGMHAETSYSFRVCSVNANVPEDISSGITITTSTTGYSISPEPAELNLTALNANEIRLNWASGGGTTSGFQISYQAGSTPPTNCNQGSVIPKSAISAATYTISGLTRETNYAFRVCSLNSNANPDISSGITGTRTTLGDAAPSNPENLQLAAHSNSSISLDWDSSGGTTSGYVITYAAGAIAPADCQSGIQVPSSNVIGTDHTFSGLNSGAAYSFRVCAVNANQIPLVSSGITGSISTLDEAAPPNPSNQNGSVISPNEISLSWLSGGGSTSSYRISYQSGALAPSSCSAGTQLTGISALSANVTGLTHETQYSFRICAINSNATPAISSGAVFSLTTSSLAAPGDASGLSATPQSGGSSVALSWSAAGGTASGYKIAYQTGASAPASCSLGTVIPSTSITGTSHTLTGLTHETQYSFKVCAVNANSVPDVSGGIDVSVTTLTQDPPPNISNLVVYVDSTTQISLSWSSGGGSTSDYKIAYQAGATAPVNCSSGTIIPASSVTGTNYSVTGLTFETQYSFRVCAINANSVPDVASGVAISATTHSLPDAPNPTGLSATANSESQITLDWTSGGGSTSDYRIAYQAGASAPASCASGTTIAEAAVSGTSKIITGLLHQAQYSFRVCAINANASPNPSSGVTITASTLAEPAPSNPTSLSATPDSASQISLAWVSGDGYTAGYRIAYQAGASAPADCASGSVISESAISGTAKVITGLIHETQYSFRICAINSNAVPDLSSGATISATTQSQAAPPNPTSPSATPNSANQITLSWNGAGGTTAGYRIAYQAGTSAPADCASGTTISEAAISGTSKAVTGLTHETQYSFRICAINANATPGASSGVSVSATTQSQVAPNEPNTQSATANSASQITLNWSSGGGTTAGYRIAYQSGVSAPANCASGTTISEAAISGTSKVITGLIHQTQYSFRICAINANTTPDVSSGITASATTQAQVVPNNPTGQTATADSSSQITLSWSSGGGTTAGYRISYQAGASAPADCASGTTISSSSIAGTNKAVTGLTHETQYSFRVCAINANATPDASSGVTASATTQSLATPNDPTGQTATANSASQITLSWASGGGTTSGYRIAYQAGASAPADCSLGTVISEGAISGTSKAITGLTHETQYSFRICAINANATPGVSIGVTAAATTQSQVAPPEPSGESATVNSSSQITLSWSSGGGTTSGYRIAYQSGASAPANCASGTTISESSITGTSKVITGLIHETQYSFRICAINANATPSVSAGVTASGTTQSQVAPLDVTGQGATADSDSQITLAWTSGGGTTSGYRIAYQSGATAPADCASGVVISEGAISGTSKAVTGLDFSTQYSFRICAINANATPNVSSGVTVTATTNSQPPAPNPASPSATTNSASQITLSWTSGGGTTAGFRISYQTGATAPASCSSGTQIGEGSIVGTSHAISGLIHETQYSFRICSINSDTPTGVSSGVTASATTQSLAAPNDPTGQSVTVDSATQITLNWSSGGGTTSGYRIAYQIGATAPANCASGVTIAEGAISGTSKAITDLTHETQYSFRICAINANATPSVSSGVTASGTTQSLAAPANPTSPSATANSSSQITLSWTSGGGTTSGYRIAYQTGATAPADCASGTTISEGSITGTSKAVTGLTHETQYSFRICAINANATPNVSSGVTASATTQSLAIPNDPISPSATDDSSSQITISWSSGGGTTSGYRIAYQSGASAPANCASGTTISEGSITGTSKVITGLTHETQYSFRICAINANATPNVSSGVTASATTQSLLAPPDPTGQSVTVNSSSQITLSWTSGGGTTSGYRISYQSGATAPATCALGTTISEASISGTSKAITSLTANTQYSFRVCSINANATPSVSSGVTATGTTLQSAPPNPTGLTGTVDSISQVTLSWTSGGGSTTGYRIAYQTSSVPADCASGTTISEASISGTSKAVTGLSTYTQYYFRVCAINGNATPDVSSGTTVTATTLQSPPLDPTAQSATANSNTQITLSWTSGGGYTSGYRIAYQSGATAPANCASGTTIAEGSISGTSKAVTGLSSYTQYSFRICAINANATPDVSSGVTATATTLYAAPPDPTSPAAATDSSTQITVSWTSGGGSTSKYRLSYQSGASAPASCAAGTTVSDATIGSATSYAVTGLSAHTQYSFRVCAINANATPDVSSGVTANATTLYAVPPDPTGQSATANSDTQITLSWTSGGGSTSGYRIAYQSGASAPANCASGTTIAEGSISGTSKAITGLSAVTQYSFRVCAINSNGTPDVSSGATATATTLQAPPPDPTSPAATGASTTSITVSWTSGGGSTADYRMSYQSGATAPTTCALGTTVSEASITGTSHTVTGLTGTNQYSFRVCAINSNGTPDVSSGVTVSGYTTPPNPSGQSATAATYSSIDLSWTSGGGSTSDYRISYQSGASAPATCAAGTTISESSVTGTTHTVSSLLASTQYSFRICAINANATPNVSAGATASVTTPAQPPPDPTDLSITTPAGGTSATLSWTSGGGTTTDYRISYQSGTTAPATCAAGTTVSEASISGTSHTVTGLTTDTFYSFRVCAIDATPVVSSGTSGSSYVAVGKFVSMAGNKGFFQCGLTNSGRAYCWGANTYGQLGDNTTTDRSVPTQVYSNLSSGENFVSLVGQKESMCGLTNKGKAYCWGYNNIGQLGNNTSTQSNVPTQIYSNLSSGENFVNLAGQNSSMCGLTNKGKAYCWGENVGGKLGDNTTVSRFVPTQVYSNLSSGENFTSLVGQNESMCALTNKGKVYCWGLNGYGQLGDNTTTSRSVPTQVYSNLSSGENFTSLAGSNSSMCGLTNKGKAYCWGYNGYGELGDNTSASRSVPTQVYSNLSSGENFTSLSTVGLDYAICGLTNKSKAYCWGQNLNGRLGDNTTTGRYVPTQVYSNLSSGENFISLAGQEDSMCGLTNKGKSYCWGDNASGGLGDNTTTQRYVPTSVVMDNVVADTGTFKSLASSMGNKHACGLSPSGQAYCWGLNDAGQLGNNTTSTTPALAVTVNTDNLLTGESFTALASGALFNCALSQTGQAYCWGSGTSGQIGNNAASSVSLPTAVATNNLATGESFKQIAAGLYNACGITQTGNAYCWGENTYGQVGDNTSTQRNLPTAVATTNLATGESFTRIEAGYRNTCGLVQTGKAYCWGRNLYGGAGDGTQVDKSRPTAVNTTNLATGESFVKIATSRHHTCALVQTGKAYCWGYNIYGQVGDNTLTNRLIPVAVNTANLATGESFVNITVGRNLSCGLTQSGSAYCWGQNASGRLGDNTTTDRLIPTAVNTSNLSTGESFLEIRSGPDAPFVCGRTNKGQTYCWGENTNGQTGDNTTTDRYIPTPVIQQGYVGY